MSGHGIKWPMKDNSLNKANPDSNSSAGFDLFRLTKSKDIVDICANTLRSYNKEGLPFYRKGKAVYVSKSDLQQFIRLKSSMQHA